PMRTVRGAISLSTSPHFAAKPYSQRANPVTLPPGRAGLATRPAATGSLTCANTIGKVLAVLQRHHGRLIAGETSIRPHPHEFGSEASQALVIPAWPALLDVDIVTFDPPEILQAPAECRHAELAFGVILCQPCNQHTDAPHPLRLLRARRERPRGCRA